MCVRVRASCTCLRVWGRDCRVHGIYVYVSISTEDHKGVGLDTPLIFWVRDCSCRVVKWRDPIMINITNLASLASPPPSRPSLIIIMVILSFISYGHTVIFWTFFASGKIMWSMLN